jgi:hypothetical protein
MVNCASASGYAFGFSPLDIVFYLCLCARARVSRGREESVRSEEEEEEERVKEEEIPLSFPENSPSKERKNERIGKEKEIRFFTSLSLSRGVVRFTALTVFEVLVQN